MSQRLRRRITNAVRVAVLGAAFVALVGCRTPDPGSSPPHGGQVPKITVAPPSSEIAALPFVTQDGTPASLGGLSGTPVLMSFIYTRCSVPSMCPLTTRNVARVQELLTEEERASVRLVSVTFDPEYDTEEVLRAYAKAYGADLSLWEFWRGTEADTETLMSTFNVWAKRAGGEYAHNMRSVIVAPDGSLSTVLRDSSWDAAEAAGRLRELARGRG